MDIQNWLQNITVKLRKEFAERVLFIGCQGSYKRGEATPDSDIDLVVILDYLTLEDLRVYKGIIRSMPQYEKACGFISGKKELKNWSRSDMFQFCYETESLYGDIRTLITPPNRKDIKAAVKSGAEALYHAAVHSYLYNEDLPGSLKELYKMAFFILQAQYFLQHGIYIATKKALLPLLANEEQRILETCLSRDRIKDYSPMQIDEAFAALISWCSKIIAK